MHARSTASQAIKNNVRITELMADKSIILSQQKVRVCKLGLEDTLTFACSSGTLAIYGASIIECRVADTRHDNSPVSLYTDTGPTYSCVNF